MVWQGSKVIIKHQRELGECTVIDNEITDMLTIVGQDQNGDIIHEPVKYYVVVDTPKAKSQKYHLKSLELLTP